MLYSGYAVFSVCSCLEGLARASWAGLAKGGGGGVNALFIFLCCGEKTVLFVSLMLFFVIVDPYKYIISGMFYLHITIVLLCFIFPRLFSVSKPSSPAPNFFIFAHTERVRCLAAASALMILYMLLMAVPAMFQEENPDGDCFCLFVFPCWGHL